MGDERTKEPGLYRADSEPPPDDPYSAPTRLGELPSQTWDDEEEQPEETRLLSAGAIDDLVSDSVSPNVLAGLPKGDKSLLVEDDLVPYESSDNNAVPQKMYDEDDADNAETLLHPSAKPQALPPPVPTSKAPAPPPPFRSLPAPEGPGAASWPFAPELGTETSQLPTRREIMVAVVMFIAAIIVFGGAALLWHLNR